jgi:2,2-dialkylglycine decarboxylase (pyruvate)
MSELPPTSNEEWWSRRGEFVIDLPETRRIVAVRSGGSEFEDQDGRRYLDLGCGQMGSLLGHGHPKLVERLIDQMRRQMHSGADLLSPPVFEAAAKLAEIAPKGLRRSLLLSTGSEANEAAIRIARTCTGRKDIVGLKKGYYGITQTTLSLGMEVDDGYAFTASDCRRVDDLDDLRKLLDAEGGRIAAMIVEPVQSAGGVIVPPKGYFVELQALLREKGALLIADECQTGFGRTGRWFGMDHYGVTPDLLVFAKGAGGGLPASGVMATEEVAAGALRRGYWHVSSHQQDPLAGAAISAVIDILRDENLIETAARRGDFLRRRLAAVREKHPDLVADVRGMGLLIGVEMRHPTGAAPERDAMTRRLYRRMLEEGVRFGYGCWNGVFRLVPALTISEDELGRAVDVFESALTRERGNH